MDANPFDALDDADEDVLQPGPAPGYIDRFMLNAEAGQRRNTILGSINDAQTETNRKDRARFDASYEAFPEWQGIFEGGFALVGQIAGTAASIENFTPIGVGHKVLVGSKMAVTGLWAKVFAGAVDGAAANAVADAAIQGIENVGGSREGFDPVQYGAGVLLGGAIGGAGGAVARGMERRADGKAVKGLYDQAGKETADIDGAFGNVFDQLDEPVADAAPAQSAAPVTGAEAQAATPADAGSSTMREAGKAAETLDSAEIAPAENGGKQAVSEAPAAPEETGLGETLSRQAGEVRGVAEAAPATPEVAAKPAAVPAETKVDGAGAEKAAKLAQAADEFMAAPKLRDQLTRPDAGIAAKAGKNVARVSETAEALAEALGVAATRQGRITQGKNVLGVYKGDSGVVRVRSREDFDVLTHEYGHHVEKRVPGMTAIMKAHAAELKALDYDPQSSRATEGFAEFFRLWLTNRAAAQKAAPRFAVAFEAEIGKHPDIAKATEAASSAWSAFLTAPSTVAVASTIVSARRKGWISKAKDVRKDGILDTLAHGMQRFYTFAFDDKNPINQAVGFLKAVHLQNTGKVLDLPVTGDAYKLARMSRGAYSAGHMDLMHGVVPYRGTNPGSPSLRDAIIMAAGKPNALSKWSDDAAHSFGSYLWSRRALGEWERFDAGDIPRAPDKLTRGDHQQNVAELEKANPQFAAAAALVHEWARALWKKRFDAGLIDEETYQGGLLIKDYVPGLRDFSSDADTKAGGKGRGGNAKSGMVKRFQGSLRDVINPLETLMSDAYQVNMEIARNDIVKALDRLALQAGPGGGAIAERVPAKQMRGTMVDPLEAVENAAKAAGLSKPDMISIRDAVEGAIGDEKAAIFRPAIINDKGEPIVFFRDGGQLRALRLADGQFGKDMYRAMTSMSPVEKNYFLEMLALPARVLRLGITLAPEFILANFVRDQAMAGLYYGRSFRRVGLSLQGAADDVLGRDAARLYSTSYGLSGGQETAALHHAMVDRDLNALKRKGWVGHRLTTWQGFFKATETAETATRLGLFRTFTKEAKARGLHDYEAAMEASWRARDYIDFDRRGSGMAAVAKIIPFLNVSLQGVDKATRHMLVPLAKKMLGQTMSAEDARAASMAWKSWARLAALVTASTSLYALQSQHEDYDEVSATTRATHWMVKHGEKWLAVPKPFEFAMFLNLGEAAYDSLVKNDPTAAGRWADSLYQTLMPPSIIEDNPAISSYFELKTNKNFFTGAPITPEYLQGMEPFLQYTARTSAIGKALGGAFGLAPTEWDHLITANLGSLGRSALSLFDLAQPDAPGFAWDDAPISRRFIKDAAKGAQSTTMFWRTVGESEGTLEGKVKSWKRYADSGDAAGAADYYASQDEQGRAYIAVSTLDADARRLHPLIRARGAVQVIGAIRRDLAANRLTDGQGKPIAIGSAARTAADDILSTLAMATARNALVTIGEPGWAQRPEMPEDGFYRELQAVSPDLAQRLADGYATKKVWRYDAVKAAWPELKARALAEGSEAQVFDLVGAVEAEGNPLDGGVAIKRKARSKLPP